ncbi:50S ribosomal protein L30e [Archaeoglobus profundus]|uniref:Large ribosomal subunit protein eL30 n=1 Tax=Archaeoglobus profundus (strain DSM 5631 / JCM 9629 / NBRC 100127 / Av18) TaxID=572546 RepID=D2RIB6_ARCPA|nr:50S ribosomal protein L30e [Archaeoglobus profundus]ADB58041.1 ribosomal protein L7Ae/L30e/S12e/Gadd45 [Archaeoglobus profundus DSM 5631]
MDVEKVLKKALKGKVYFGSKRTIKALKRGEAKLVIVSANCPKDIREKIEKYKKNVPVLVYPGTNMELGAACGKPFSVASLAVIDADIELLTV